jgi:hypothetical protein
MYDNIVVSCHVYECPQGIISFDGVQHHVEISFVLHALTPHCAKGNAYPQLGIMTIIIRMVSLCEAQAYCWALIWAKLLLKTHLFH